MLTRLIPVTRTEARYVAALPGMPHGKHAQVLAAVPEGFRIAPARQGGAAWLAALVDSPDFQGLRRDRQANVRALAEFLSVARRYEHGILRPGLAALRAVLPDVCAETVYRVLRWLRERRWLGHVQRGSTERYRGRADGRGNLAAEFVPLMPGRAADDRRSAGSIRSKNARPNRSTSWNRKDSLRERAQPPQPHEHRSEQNWSKTFMEPLRGRQSPKPAHAGNSSPEKKRHGRAPRSTWPARQVPKTRRDRLVAVQALQVDLPDLRRLSDRAVRSLLRPWYLAGWTNHDIKHALDHTPGGVQHRYGGAEHRVRYLAGWMRSRLSLWLAIDSAGHATDQPGDSPTVRRQRQADQERMTGRPAPTQESQPLASAVTRAAALVAISATLSAARSRRPAPSGEIPTLGWSPRAWRIVGSRS